MEHHLEEHVTKLFAQMLGASLVDGLAGLIGLLQQIAADGLVVLLRVPGAASRARRMATIRSRSETS